MATVPPVKSDEYYAHLFTFQQSVKDGVGEAYTKSKDAHWKIWDSHQGHNYNGVRHAVCALRSYGAIFFSQRSYKLRKS